MEMLGNDVPIFILYKKNTSTYNSTDLLTARGVAHLVVHGTSGSTSYETIPRPLERCCRPWTWWCNNATTLAGYANMMMMMMMMMMMIYLFRRGTREVAPIFVYKDETVCEKLTSWLRPCILFTIQCTLVCVPFPRIFFLVGGV